MIFSEKLQILRKNKGYTQEALADKLGVTRQAVAKWEAGQVYPDITNLIQISDLLNVSVDYLVKDQDCAVNIKSQPATDLDELIAFRLEANVNTYAAFMNEVEGSRLTSHDFRYDNGKYTYYDTYVGGEEFAGEEAVWKDGVAVYAMNYMGRVLSDGFSGNFLKEDAVQRTGVLSGRRVHIQVQGHRRFHVVPGLRRDLSGRRQSVRVCVPRRAGKVK